MKTIVKLLLLLFLSTFTVKAEEIRVGITEYQNVEQVYRKYQEFFDELERIAHDDGLEIHFKFAIGTYSEVIDWYSKKLIDVAVLSAMPVADLLSISDKAQKDKIREAFLAKLNPVGGRIVKCQAANPCRRSLDEPSAQCAPEAGQPQTARPEYHVTAIVPAEYGWKNFDDVRKHAGKKQLKFLFVRPVSISGYIVPSYYLKEIQKIDPKQEEFDFTYQHQESLQRIIKKDKKDEGKKVVAFVIENTSYCVPEDDANKQFFTKLEADKLSSIDIPHEVMLVNSNLDKDRLDEVRGAMGHLLEERAKLEKSGTPKGFTLTMRKELPADWLEVYDESTRIYESTRSARPLAYGTSFEDLIRSLRIYKDSTGEDPRLALVLSGGGAKCAYQAGAVSQIENKLSELKKDPRYEKIDFDLVVGTSGGAINALLVALGGTSDPRTQDSIFKMWTSFHQEHFFTPSPVFNVVFGLCFGLLQALVITLAVLLFGRKRLRWARIGQLLLAVEVIQLGLAAYFGILTSAFAAFMIAQVVFVVVVAAVIRSIRRTGERFLQTRAGGWWCRVYKDKVGDWWRIAGWLMLIISTIEFLIARGLSLSSWPSELESHTLTHLWLLFLLICSGAYPWPLFLGLVMVLSGIAGYVDIDWHGRRRWLVRMLTASVLMFAGILILNSLWKDSSLSKSIQIERAFIRRVPEMLAVLHNGFAPASGQHENEQLVDISQRIVNHPSMLKRDLVITVSNLPLSEYQQVNPGHITANDMPEDLYFYYDAQKPGTKPPPNEKRFISFRENPDKLLDVVIGSGTIYPLFPFRDLRNVNIGAGKVVEQINVIDGGFIHNSPVEAAITWGATHIISIEASPEPKPFDPRNTFENSLVAFSYIMAQTQRVDATVRGEAEIFELRPRSDCEKKNLENRCNPDPEPNMDTFDFDRKIVGNAFMIGQADAGSELPLFKRVTGPPRFRQTKRQNHAELQARLKRKEVPHALARKIPKYPLAPIARVNRD
ncbi:MAG TPA: patatin-like phospholipase family protein [Pyrinomonadaceae bacterium]|nr:patatin-like phospholipase family protein [Pyrinomonadaceae bacterium]